MSACSFCVLYWYRVVSAFLSVLGWWRFVSHDCARESVADAVLYESSSSYFLLRVQGEKERGPTASVGCPFSYGAGMKSSTKVNQIGMSERKRATGSFKNTKNLLSISRVFLLKMALCDVCKRGKVSTALMIRRSFWLNFSHGSSAINCSCDQHP